MIYMEYCCALSSFFMLLFTLSLYGRKKCEHYVKYLHILAFHKINNII